MEAKYSHHHVGDSWKIYAILVILEFIAYVSMLSAGLYVHVGSILGPLVVHVYLMLGFHTLSFKSIISNHGSSTEINISPSTNCSDKHSEKPTQNKPNRNQENVSALDNNSRLMLQFGPCNVPCTNQDTQIYYSDIEYFTIHDYSRSKHHYGIRATGWDCSNKKNFCCLFCYCTNLVYSNGLCPCNFCRAGCWEMRLFPFCQTLFTCGTGCGMHKQWKKSNYNGSVTDVGGINTAAVAIDGGRENDGTLMRDVSYDDCKVFQFHMLHQDESRLMFDCPNTKRIENFMVVTDDVENFTAHLLDMNVKLLETDCIDEKSATASNGSLEQELMINLSNENIA